MINLILLFIHSEAVVLEQPSIEAIVLEFYSIMHLNRPNKCDAFQQEQLSK